MGYQGLLAILLILSVVYALNHVALVRFSKRPFRLPDYITMGWCIAYTPAFVFSVLAGALALGIVEDLANNAIANITALIIIVGLPALISACIAAWAWDSAVPPLALIAVTPLICWLVTRSDSPVWHLLGGMAWNTAYASSCIAPVLKTRRIQQRTQRDDCQSCGYSQRGIPSKSRCPECGWAPEFSPPNTSLSI